jgi:predicted amidohydrolase
MKVLGLQFAITWENKAANFEKVRSMLTAAPPEQETLVVLPEMFATGFSMNTGTVAEPYGGETEGFLGTLAADFGVYVIGGAAMRAKDGRARNKALCFSPEGKLIAWYAKIQPFAPGGEAEHYTAGERTTVFSWERCHVSPFVCYDLRFPELFREAAAAHRPELFVVIASWPDKRVHHWTRLLQARAIENQAYVIGVNRIGTDPYYEYSGQSAVVDPDGNLIAAAGDKETCVEAELDLENLTKYRAGLPFLNDMKV